MGVNIIHTHTHATTKMNNNIIKTAAKPIILRPSKNSFLGGNQSGNHIGNQIAKKSNTCASVSNSIYN